MPLRPLNCESVFSAFGPRNHRDCRFVGGLVAKSDTQSRSQQQRKHKHPEYDFRFTLELEYARPEQMTVSRPAPVAEPAVTSSARRQRGSPLILFIVTKRRCIGFRCHSLFSQVTPGKLHEHVFEASLSRAQVFKLMAVARHRIQERRNRKVRLANTEA